MIDLLTGDGIPEATELAGELEGLTRGERAKLRMLLFATEQKLERLTALREALRKVVGVRAKKGERKTMVRAREPDTRGNGTAR